MNIQGIGIRPDLAIQQQKQPIVRGKSGIAQEFKEAIQAKVETGDGGQVKQGEQRGTGVVGLLQDGHFKGVADVRLRINFHDQLQTDTTQQRTELATGNGVAYSRFLEMYNALEGKSGSDEAAGADTGGIVTEA